MIFWVFYDRTLQARLSTGRPPRLGREILLRDPLAVDYPLSSGVVHGGEPIFPCKIIAVSDRVTARLSSLSEGRLFNYSLSHLQP